uniref:SAP domain-containing protein n=1 Tax=Leersia perrieri TaxID=77586 RepID=A0A0D9VUM5_9ORYZ
MKAHLQTIRRFCSARTPPVSRPAPKPLERSKPPSPLAVPAPHAPTHPSFPSPSTPRAAVQTLELHATSARGGAKLQSSLLLPPRFSNLSSPPGPLALDRGILLFRFLSARFSVWGIFFGARGLGGFAAAGFWRLREVGVPLSLTFHLSAPGLSATMSSYPVLNNRPIDQWRVTDLKDELRKRRLPVKGLKDELVRRLFDSIQSEQAVDEGNENVEVDPAADQAPEIEDVNHKTTVSISEVHKETVVQETAPPVTEVSQPSTVSAVEEPPQVNVVVETYKDPVSEAPTAKDPTAKEEEAQSIAGDLSTMQNEHLHAESNTKPFVEKMQEVGTNETVGVHEMTTADVQSDMASSDVKTDATEAGKVQYDTVSATMDAIPTDADPMDTDAATEKVVLNDLDGNSSVHDEESKDSELMNEDGKPITPKPNDQKLNLDRSSGDESMEEDVMEIKQVESNIKSEGTTEFSSDHVKEASLPDSVVDGSSVDTKEVIAEEKTAASTEKRKLEAEETVTVTEPIKRQRRWAADGAKVPERQPLSHSGSDAPKEIFQPALKRSFGRSDSTVSVDSPKERVVPPSQKPATTSLRIDRFVRPFTLKAVQELLGKTGSVCSFWMDHIKTHCYVTFSSVEEAVATRDAVYDLQWPPNNGNRLVAEFVDPQEVKLKLEPPPPAAAPVSPATPKEPPFQQAQANQNAPRQAAAPREHLPPPPPLIKPPTSDPGLAKERLPPTPKKQPEPPVVTLDDLFKKTQSSPRIYYLPLSEEEVTAKLASQGKGKRE